MIQGQAYYPNANPSSYPIKIWDVVGTVVPTAHTTQQKSLIGSSSKIKLFIGHNADVNISVTILFLPARILPHIPLTHIYMSHISHFGKESSSIQY